MKQLLSLLFFFTCLFSFEKQPESLFSESYDDAIEFINKHQLLIAEELGNNKDVLKQKLAIVFPELLKYSAYKDIIETTALELLYVNYGTAAADFSIGYFQMKPSFIEKLENEILNNYQLSNEFGSIINYRITSAKEIRKERIARLTQLKWQLRYLNCFYKYMSYRFANEKWLSNADKLCFYSAAYNSDFKASRKEIERWSKMKIFPYGIQKGINQYSYSAIALDFYKKSSSDISIF